MCWQCESCCRRPLRNIFSKVGYWSVGNGWLVFDIKSEKFLILSLNIYCSLASRCQTNWSQIFAIRLSLLARRLRLCRCRKCLSVTSIEIFDEWNGMMIASRALCPLVVEFEKWAIPVLSDRHLKRLGHKIHQNILFYYHYHVFGKKKSISAAQRFYKYW